MILKDKITYIRAHLNLTQEELAKEMGVSFATINRWETGKNNPTKKTQQQLDTFCSQHNIILPDEKVLRVFEGFAGNNFRGLLP